MSAARETLIDKIRNLSERVRALEVTARRKLAAIVSDEGDLRVVRGIVDTTAGTIVEPSTGAEFTVTRNGVGDVTIDFTVAFADVPTVVPGATGAGDFTCQLATPPTVSVAQITRRGGSALADGRVHFVAFGPR